MAKKSKHPTNDGPYYHRDHKRPVSRRDFLGQGFLAGLVPGWYWAAARC